MMNHMPKIVYVFVAGLLVLSCHQDPSQATETQDAPESMLAPPTAQDAPDLVEGKLFHDVEMAHLFPDSKTFADAAPKVDLNDIMNRYEREGSLSGDKLKAFVEENFTLPATQSTDYQSDRGQDLGEHLKSLWPILTRQPEPQQPGSLIALPKPYVVPGGRFREIYYWDSYFTMLGLSVSDRWDLVRDMIDNFAFLIDTYGFIPNGSRTYFLTRSQPPFFSLMVSLLASQDGTEVYKKYFPELLKEYLFWTDGIDKIPAPMTAYRRVVRAHNMGVLNRYWDDSPRPRPESYREDVELANNSSEVDTVLYRNIRAACESGWDFSSRWMRDGARDLGSLVTTEIIPVDLNALLYHLEKVLAMGAKELGDPEAVAYYEQRMEYRKEELRKLCWDNINGYFNDYWWAQKRPAGSPSLAGVYPLYMGIATQEEAEKSAKFLERLFLKPGGLMTTLLNTGQQWDSPNGWAPLQWMAIVGLRNYNLDDLADAIKERWMRVNQDVYRNTGKMTEKYIVTDLTGEQAGGGEYPNQDGFGWTNGVWLALQANLDLRWGSVEGPQ